MVKSFARRTFAELACEGPSQLRWSKFGYVMGVPEEIPSSKWFFKQLENDIRTRGAVLNLYKAVKAARS